METESHMSDVIRSQDVIQNQNMTLDMKQARNVKREDENGTDILVQVDVDPGHFINQQIKRQGSDFGNPVSEYEVPLFTDSLCEPVLETEETYEENGKVSCVKQEGNDDRNDVVQANIEFAYFNEPLIKGEEESSDSGNSIPDFNAPLIIDTHHLSDLNDIAIRLSYQQNKDDLEKLDFKNKTKQFVCKYCPYANKVQSNVSSHEIIHMDNKSYITNDKNKEKYPPNSNVKGRDRTIKCDKPYNCDICHQTFSHHSYLKIHKQIHTGDKPYSCDICERTFTQNSSLIRHKRIHTGDKPHSCEICKKTFSESNHLIRHRRIHTGDKPYSCEICKKTFSISGNLIAHIRIHTGDKPFTCEICERAFSHSSYLISHKRIHTGEKPHICDICGRAFYTNCDLIRHKRIHTGDKPYGCNLCEEKFSVSSSLITHKRKHTGEKPFTCEICKRTFSRSNSLLIHKRSHTGEKPYNCDICNKAFSRNSTLTRHKTKHKCDKP